MVSQRQRNEAVARLEEVFSDWPMPQQVADEMRGSSPDPEYEEMLVKLRSVRHWSELDDESMRDFIPSLFSTTLYEYFQPAFLRFAIRNHDEVEGMTSITLVSLVEQISQLPKIGAELSLRMDFKRYASEQVTAVKNAIEFIMRLETASGKRFREHIPKVLAELDRIAQDKARREF